MIARLVSWKVALNCFDVEILSKMWNCALLKIHNRHNKHEEFLIKFTCWLLVFKICKDDNYTKKLDMCLWNTDAPGGNKVKICQNL